MRGRDSIWLPLALVGLVLAQHTFGKTFVAVWQGGWPLIALVAAAWILAGACRKATMAFVPLFAIVTISGIAVGMAGAGLPTFGTTDWPAGRVSNISVHTSARMFSLISLTSFLALTAIGITISKKTAGYLAEALSYGGAITAASIVFEALVLRRPVANQVWVMDNPGCAAGFAVFGILWLLAKLRASREVTALERRILTILILAVLSVLLILVKASTPIAATMAGLFVLLKAEKPRVALTMLLLTGVVAVAFLVSSGYSFEADASGRLELWRAAWNYWSADRWRLIFGSGLGTATMLAPLLTSKGWYFLHSDLLQIGFEIGLVGLVATMIAVAKTLREFRFNLPMMAVAVAFMVSMITNFTGHISADALWLLAILRSAV